MRYLLVALLVAAAALTGRAQGAARTAWGDPDLQGIWPSGQLITVPFERPVDLGTRAELTEAEFAQRVAAAQRQAEADAAEFSTPAPVNAPLAPSHWLESGRPSRQTSLIVDPPNGRLPPMTEDGARRAREWPSTNPAVGYARAQDFNIYDRCITRGVLGSTFPNIYSSGIEIHQAPGLVAIRYEMVHETRVIPLDGRAHAGAGIRSYMATATRRATRSASSSGSPGATRTRSTIQSSSTIRGPGRGRGRWRFRCSAIPRTGSTNTPATKATTPSSTCCAVSGLPSAPPGNSRWRRSQRSAYSTTTARSRDGSSKRRWTS
jgi:hypothetical protein